MGLLQLTDVCVSAGIIFITVWFFFVQSPFLFQRLGREKFVPIMMQITQLYFKFIVALHGIVVVLSTLRSSGEGLGQTQNLSAYVSGLVASFNFCVIVPRALERGRVSMRERKGTNDSSSVKDFAIEGGSKTKTRGMHQLVVLFVLLDVSALAAHIILS